MIVFIMTSEIDYTEDDYICPIDGNTMNRANLGDGYESNFGAVCGTCRFESSNRDSGTLQEQAVRYVSGVIVVYQSLKDKKKALLDELDWTRSGLEEKLDLLKSCAQGEFVGPLARVIKYDRV